MSSFTWPLLALTSFAALLHASFQLGVSLLTMLSSHGIGKQRHHRSILRLGLAYVLGCVFLVSLLFASLAYFASIASTPREPIMWWIVVASLNVGIGLSVSLFYYRKGKGTELWIPRQFATFLANRTKKIEHSAEAFTLGLASVASELLFIIGPLSAAVLYAVRFTADLQLAALVSYVIISCLPLLIVLAMVGSGHKMSTIQRWRERNKRFLQYAAGSGLIIFGLYLFVAEVVTPLAFEGVTIL